MLLYEDQSEHEFTLFVTEQQMLKKLVDFY
jgi:hypothetical protein